MAKNKSKYVCQNCGYEQPRWLGKCPSCGEWNSFVEEMIIPEDNQKYQRGLGADLGASKMSLIEDIKSIDVSRIKTNNAELDRVLGGGIVKSSLVLVGGDPGIGKSTLLLQVANTCSSQNLSVLYVSGEESPEQIKMRASRLNVGKGNLYVLSETNIDIIAKHIKKEEPDILILDSIQTIYKPDVTSAPGTVSQVREITSEVLRMTKSRKMATFIVGHVTKSGNIAGPKVLEHMVDTVLYFEGERHFSFRVLRAVKNRFGSTNEIGVFEMRENGLNEVDNPSEIFIEGRPKGAYGTVVSTSLEGSRPMLVEIQALVAYSPMGFAKQITTGVEKNRISLLVAILEKIVGMNIQSCDVFINVTGGIQLKEPAQDLAIITAIASSFKEKPIDFKTVVLGEVGLTGEVRGVGSIQNRVMEAQKMGFEKAIVPLANITAAKEIKGIDIIGVSNVKEACDRLFK